MGKTTKKAWEKVEKVSETLEKWMGASLVKQVTSAVYATQNILAGLRENQ